MHQIVTSVNMLLIVVKKKIQFWSKNKITPWVGNPWKRAISTKNYVKFHAIQLACLFSRNTH